MIVDLAHGMPEYPAGSVLVVGSGAAGIALAEQVSAAGRSVVLLESGGDLTDDISPSTAQLNTGTVVGQAYDGLDLGRARTLGGTTLLWHGQCMRLHELDVRERAWMAGSGWPLTLADLDAYYARAERCWA